MDNVASMTASGDYVALPNEEHYRIYFDQMRTVCTVLQNWAESKMGESSPEGECVAAFGGQILRSIEMLRLKYLAEGSEKLKLDLNESGFPHYNEIVKLENDALHAANTLRAIPPRALAIEDALSRLFEDSEIPTEELHQLAERHYLEELSEEEFLETFRFGGIKSLGSTRRFRDMACSWACYNPDDNLIYLHLLEFQQDTSEPLLEEGSATYQPFLDVIKRLGNRASPLVVLATGIDEELNSIHPKVLRRLRIGPILSSRFSFDSCDLSKFLRNEGDPDDLIFSLESEVIVSSRQIIKERGWLFIPDTIREVFSIPHEESERFERKLTELTRVLFMPHHLWQTSFANSNPTWLAEFDEAERIAYNSAGEAHKV